MSEKIIIVGYPKSGNTWLNRLLAEVIDCPQKGYLDKGEKYPEISKEGLERKSTYEVWKTHSSIDIIEKFDIKLHNTIYIIRDPRDVAISSSHYFNFTLNQCINKMISGELAKKAVQNRSWDQHVKEWKNKNIHIIKYENMLTNPFLEIISILKYLNIEDISDDHIKNSIKNQSFENKKKTSNINKSFLRKGTSNQFRTEMNKKQKDKCKNAFTDIMKELDYIK